MRTSLARDLYDLAWLASRPWTSFDRGPKTRHFEGRSGLVSSRLNA